jgi:hypothetical protein
MPWEDVLERIIDRRYQEQNRPRGFIPEDHASMRHEREGEGRRVRDNGRFHDQTGIPLLGIDFGIGG